MFFFKSENKVLIGCWTLVLLAIPLIAILGDFLQSIVGQTIGDTGIIVLFGGMIAGGLLGTGIYIFLWVDPNDIVHLLWMALIAGIMMYHVFDNPERWYHLPVYGIFGYFSVRVFAGRTGLEVATAIAFLDEFLQHYLPYRTGSVEDVFINVVSVGLGSMVWILIDRSE